MIVDAEPRIGSALVAGEGEMIGVVFQELRQKGVALRIIHGPIEQQMSEPRAFRKRGGKVGVAGCQFLGHDAAGQRIHPGAAALLRQSERAQAQLRGGVDLVRQQAAVADIEAVRLERRRLDLARHEVAHRVADFQLFGAELKIVHDWVFPSFAWPARYCCTAAAMAFPMSWVLALPPRSGVRCLACVTTLSIAACI